MPPRRDYHLPGDTPVSARLGPELKAWLDAHAGRTGRSRQALVIEAVKLLRDHAAAKPASRQAGSSNSSA